MPIGCWNGIGIRGENFLLSISKSPRILSLHGYLRDDLVSQSGSTTRHYNRHSRGSRCIPHQNNLEYKCVNRSGYKYCVREPFRAIYKFPKPNVLVYLVKTVGMTILQWSDWIVSAKSSHYLSSPTLSCIAKQEPGRSCRSSLHIP